MGAERWKSWAKGNLASLCAGVKGESPDQGWRRWREQAQVWGGYHQPFPGQCSQGSVSTSWEQVGDGRGCMAGGGNRALLRELWAHWPGMQGREWFLEAAGLGSSANSILLPCLMLGKCLLISGPLYPSQLLGKISTQTPYSFGDAGE